MALIQCPTCGREVSENANACPFCGEPLASKVDAEVDSGTLHFTVTGEDRIRLSARTEQEIQAKTNELNAQGKTVTSINTTAPQPFHAVFTYWMCEVTIVWQASCASERYKEHLYNQAKEDYGAGRYEKAKKDFERLHTFKEASEMALKCQKAIEREEREKHKVDDEREALREYMREAAARRKEMEKVIGTDGSTTSNGIVRYMLSVLLIIIGLCKISTSAGIVMISIGLIMIAYNLIVHKRYQKKVEQYNQDEEKGENK